MFETPLVYGCEISARMCLLTPEKNDSADPLDDYATVNGTYRWIHIVIGNDQQFHKQESVLTGLTYRIVRNGSLFYCTSNDRCRGSEVNETMNVVAVIQGKRLGQDEQ